MVIGLIIYLLLDIILFINTYFLYFSNGFSLSYDGAINGVITLFFIFLVFLVALLGFNSSKRKRRKRAYQINFYILLVLLSLSIFARIRSGVLAWWPLSNTILYFILFVMTIYFAYKLYKRLLYIKKYTC
jgi:Ca2+/Na+ antiporter